MKLDKEQQIDGKYLGTITEDFVKVAHIISEASFQIRKRKFSEFPIFIMSKTSIAFDSLLISKESHNTTWNYYASFLENLIENKIIFPQKTAHFKTVYKNPDEFCCLLVIEKEYFNFVSLPYPEGENSL